MLIYCSNNGTIILYGNNKSYTDRPEYATIHDLDQPNNVSLFRSKYWAEVGEEVEFKELLKAIRCIAK